MKKIITRISEGLGNQLFMYANSYALSRNLDYEFFIDNISAYRKLKIRSFLLDNFNITAKKANTEDIQDNYYKYFFHKIDKKFDILRNKKKFLIEKKDKHKKTQFYDLSQFSFSDKVFVEGFFESEKYFINYKKDILKQFTIKKINTKYLFIDPRQVLNHNSVSLVIRKNRFSEKISNSLSNEKSRLFEKRTIDYVFKSIEFLSSKISNPRFFIFSNDPTGLFDIFSNLKNCTVVLHQNNKAINDFYLSTLCKHFIVGPSTFHWWSAYASTNKEKICIRPPSDLNFSSNKDIYPDEWLHLNF